MQQTEGFETSVLIDAPPERVWETLSNPLHMLKWMGDPELDLQVLTTWRVGEPIIIRGFHHVPFENRGTVLAFEPFKTIRYSHLSSVSRLPDRPESYSVIEFRLQPLQDQTMLAIAISIFPTKSIFKHLQFYWRNTSAIIKQVAEGAWCHH